LILKNVLHLSVFAKYCWPIHFKVVKLSKNAHIKQRKATATHSAVSRQVYVHALLVQHLQYIVYFLNIWFGMVQHQKQLGWKKMIKIYWIYRA